MRNIMSYFAFSAVFALPVALLGYPTVADNSWQKVGGDASGCVTNVAYWNGGHVPTLLERMKFGVSANYTVTFPANETVAYPAGAYFSAAAGNVLSVVGDDATWYTPSTTDDNYAQYPLCFYCGGEFCSVNQQWTTNVLNHSLFEFKDFAFTLSNTTDCASLTFERGTYNFFDPHGESWADLKAAGTIGVYPPFILHAMSSSTKSSRVVFGPQSSLRAADLSVHAYAAQTLTEFRGGTHEIMGDLFMPKVGGNAQTFASTNTFAVTAGAKLTIANKITIGHSAQSLKTHRLVVTDGATLAITHADGSVSRKNDSSETVELLITDRGRLETAGPVQLGAYKDHRDAIVVSNGTWIAAKGVNLGCGTFVVDGADAKLALGDTLTIGSTASTLSTDLRTAEMTIKDGTVDVNLEFYIGNSQNTRGTLRLNGGTLRCGTIYGVASKGESAVIADGGKIAVSKASSLFSGIGSVTIGPGGLVVDTEGHTVTLSQDISGTGTITFVGGGNVSLTPGMTCTAGIAAKDGVTLRLNGVTTGSLTLGAVGSPCVLPVDLAVTNRVNGPVSFVNASLDFPAATVAEGLYSLFVGTSAQGREAWEEVVNDIQVPAGYAAIFELNGASLDVNVRLPQVTPVSVDAPEKKTVSEDITVNRADAIAASAVKGGELTLSGVLGHGQLQKSGEGIVRLTNAANDLKRGISVSGGTLALDFGDGEKKEKILTVASDDPAKGVIVKTDSDVTFADAQMTSGAFIKRGTGTLTLEIPANRDWTGLTAGEIVQAGNAHGWPYLPFAGFDESGAVPTNGYGVVNVAEGELVIRGTSETVPSVTPTTARNTLVGLGNPTGGANPRLVFDHVTYDPDKLTTIDVASGLRTNAFETAASLVVTNGANAMVKHFTAGSAGLMSAVKHTGPVKVVPVDVLVDNGVLGATYGMALSAGSDASVTNVFTLRNGSRLVKGTIGHVQFQAYGPVRIVASDSVMTCVDNGVDRPAEYQAYSASASLSLDFTRSRLALQRFFFYDGTKNPSFSSFTFEDSEWWPGAANFDFLPDTFSNVVVSVRGKGLVLNPAADVTYKMSMDINGAGGLVKRGAGTLVLDDAHRKYAGTTVVEAGVLDLAGSTWQGARIAGAGTVANGALSRSTIVLDVTDDGASWTAAAVPTLSCATSGRFHVDLGRTEANPLSLPYRTLTVARFQGTAPDVSNWRLTGTGIPHTAGSFAVVGDEIRVTARPAPGLCVILR